MVQKHVVEAIGSARLRVYYVWQPILPSDTRAAARARARAIRDPRVRSFWDTVHQLGDAFGRLLELPDGRPAAFDGHRIAWDMYLLYPPGVRWTTQLPKPSYWQHQLRGLPRESRLDGPALRGRILRALARGEGRSGRP